MAIERIVIGEPRESSNFCPEATHASTELTPHPKACSSMPGTRQGPQSCEESSFKAVLQLRDELLVCSVVCRVAPEDVVPCSTHLFRCMCCISRMGMQSLCPLYQSVYFCYLTLSNRIVTRLAHSIDLKCALT